MPEATTTEETKPKKAKKKRSFRQHINPERCKGCGFCIEFCPKSVYEFAEAFNSKGYHPPQVADSTKCIGCQLCYMLCPEFAIFIERLEDEKTEESD